MTMALLWTAELLPCTRNTRLHDGWCGPQDDSDSLGLGDTAA